MNAVYGSVLNSISTKPGREVVTNQGGIAFNVDALKRVKRFLIIGSEGGSFYVNERDLTIENAKAVVEALDLHGSKVVDLIIEVSTKGLAPRQQPTLMALALAASHKDLSARRAALDAIPRVCRTGTMLFEFVEYVDSLRGWGKGLRNAIGNWYDLKSPRDLVLQAIKYRQRNGWSHADLLRKARPLAIDQEHDAIYKWIVDREFKDGAESLDSLDLLFAFEFAQKTDDKNMLISTIVDFKLPREAIPTHWLKDPDVWAALLQDMPMTAMIRNLGVMSSIGLVTQGSDAARLVIERLSDADRLQKARVHPMKVLEALKTYEQGHGIRGSNTWRAVPQVVDALDGAFYGAFKNVVPTNKRVLVAVDVSGSMYTHVNGFPMSCSQAAAAMTLVTVATEPLAEVVAFDTSIRNVTISPRQRLDDVIRKLDAWGGGTDCVLPINYASTTGGRYDGIITYTDSENGGNRVHTRLDAYRARHNPSCKFVTAAMAANRFSLSRPTDPHSLDVVGLSADAPALIADFIDDRI